MNRLARSGAPLFLFLFVAGCAAVQLNPPSLSIAEISVGELTAGGRSYTMQLLIRNPNRQELPLTGISFELVLDGSAAIRTRQDINVFVAPFGTERLRFELDGRSDEPARALMELARRRGSLGYRISGHFVSPLTEDLIRFQRRSQLHPTPGAPMKFRSGT